MMRKKWIKVLLTAALTTGCLLLSACGGEQNHKVDAADEQTAVDTGSALTDTKLAEGEQASEEEQEPGILLPLELDGGRLILNSVFGSDIDNPDCNNEFGENIVSVEFVNASENTLKSVDFELTLEDGTAVPVHAENIPAGAATWAFAADNAAVSSMICTDIQVSTEYASGNLSEDNRFEITVNDTEIQITNVSSESFSDLTVYCHCDMGDALFGGVAYAYPLDRIEPDETVVIYADDCFMGTVKVASVE